MGIRHELRPTDQTILRTRHSSESFSRVTGLLLLLLLLLFCNFVYVVLFSLLPFCVFVIVVVVFGFCYSCRSFVFSLLSFSVFAIVVFLCFHYRCDVVVVMWLLLLFSEVSVF